MSEGTWKSASAELDSSVLLRTLDLLPDGILLVDGNRTAKYANAAFVRMWGLSGSLIASLKGQDRNLIRYAVQQLENPSSFMAEVERLYASAETSRDEVVLKDGRIFQRRSVPLQRGESGRIWVFTDITDERLSRNDALTGLGNRRSYAEEFPRFVKARADGAWRAVTLLDIDHFKALNDADGHAQGDEVLRRVAAFLSDHVRGGDAAYRIGGEEFLITSRHRSDTGAADFAERLRTGIMDERIGHKGNGELGVITVSIGMGAFRNPHDPDRLFEAVDEALYRAKASGRNRVERAIIPDGGHPLKAAAHGAASLR